ncbi:MAG: hypothetical protein HYZ36_03940 [Pedosphaera parvula]|nr:hypothetical protein [Verrucomicrobiota bacterium]MBI3191795.1 hypothetical protein [Pedosphaera parvula]
MKGIARSLDPFTARDRHSDDPFAKVLARCLAPSAPQQRTRLTRALPDEASVPVRVGGGTSRCPALRCPHSVTLYTLRRRT